MIQFWQECLGSDFCAASWHLYTMFLVMVRSSLNKEIYNHLVITFLVGLYKDKIILFFTFSCFRKQLHNQTAAAKMRLILSFFANCSKQNLFISANTYEIYIACKEYCIAHQDDKLCFQHICRYHIILKGDNDKLLQKLDKFCFTSHHVDCLYTWFKCLFSGKNVAKSGQNFDNMQRAD